MKIKLPLELVFWIVALVLLATANPGGHHYTLCPLANLGIDWCPGCGLGRSITLLFHGQWMQSFNQHWLGAPAVMIIVYRIAQLAKNEWRKRNLTIKISGGINHV